MKIIEKFKNMFTEEVEVEETPIQKQPEMPKKEEETVVVKKMEPPVAETVTPKREEKFVFPIYFDDKDFAKLEQKEEVKKEVPNAYGTKIEKTEEVKIFKPTPIISPVYGVLNKDYVKEDIIPPRKTFSTDKPLTLDEVRRKAYGTLEEDLGSLKQSIFAETKEDTLMDDLLLNNEVTEDEYSSVDDFLKGDYESKHSEKEVSLFDNLLNDETELPKEDKDEYSDMEATDLLNLIDSMYKEDDNSEQ
jgi:hypothetical protein